MPDERHEGQAAAGALERKLDAARYVRQLTHELLALAQKSRLETVAHLLDMTRLQAEHDVEELNSELARKKRVS